MNLTRWWLLALLVATGCAHRAHNTELLEVELRHLEDQIYCMEDEVAEAHRRYDTLCEENEQLREQIERSGQTVEPTRRPPLFPGLAPRSEATPSYEAPRYDSTSSEPALDTAPPFEAPPQIQPPSANTPEGESPSLPPTNAAPSDETSPIGPPATQPLESTVPGGSADATAPPAADGLTEPVAVAPTEVGPGEPIEPRALPGSAPGDPTITAVTLNQAETHGLDADGQPGHEAIAVLIEPRNTAGEIVPAPAEISIVVLDPALLGQAARIARWDFSPDEAQDHVHPDGAAIGLHFDLAWPDRAPSNKNLMLFVRYTLANREQFVVDQPIEIDPPAVQAYQPSPSDWNASQRTAGVPTPADPHMAARPGAMPPRGAYPQRGPMARLTQRGGYAPQHGPNTGPQPYQNMAPQQSGPRYAPQSRGSQWSPGPGGSRAAPRARGFVYPSAADGGWNPGR
ncbi:MAG: hypothetical protein K2Y37_01755 [Pirellulales bacterium]|nr:hypothetical protein [Pirellulales bacterium]